MEGHKLQFVAKIRQVRTIVKRIGRTVLVHNCCTRAMDERDL